MQRKRTVELFEFRIKPYGGALEHLKRYAVGFDFSLGHNIILFELPKLVAGRPGLARVGVLAIDTLWLSLLAIRLHSKASSSTTVKPYTAGRR